MYTFKLSKTPINAIIPTFTRFLCQGVARTNVVKYAYTLFPFNFVYCLLASFIHLIKSSCLTAQTIVPLLAHHYL